MCVLNPIKTCQMRKNNIRKTKTDKIDTYVIAKTLMMQDNLRFVSFFDLDMMDLKALGRFRLKTIKQRTQLKIQLTTYVDQVFPEIQYFFLIRSASARRLCFIERSIVTHIIFSLIYNIISLFYISSNYNTFYTMPCEITSTLFSL